MSKVKNQPACRSKLTAWFSLNLEDEEARKHLYHDIPKYYVWKSTEKVWSRRNKNKVSNMIGRVFFFSPKDVERFSMRLLLLNKKGATSFEDLRTHDNIKFDTFQACAIYRGLLADDKTWDNTMEEASEHTTDIRQLRLLFAMILTQGNPSNPGALWQKHKKDLSQDILYNQRIKFNNPILPLNEDMLTLSLYFLNEILNTYNKSLRDFHGLPMLPLNYNPNSIILHDNETNKFNSIKPIMIELR